MLKRDFTEDEKYGLTNEEYRIAVRYLRKNKTAGALKPQHSTKLYEMYLLGCTFGEIQKQFPNYSLDEILLTAALNKWGRERDKVQHTIKDRIKAKVIKSVVDQVDFLSTMLAVSNAEHLDDMRKFAMDPKNNPPPKLKINSIKEYKDVAESLYKIVQGVGPGSNKPSPMLDALSGDSDKSQIESQDSKKKNNEDDVIDVEKLIEMEKQSGK